MFTITLKEAKKQIKRIMEMCPPDEVFAKWEAKEGCYEKVELEIAIKELVELVYKSGEHDGWYDAMDQVQEEEKSKK